MAFTVDVTGITTSATPGTVGIQTTERNSFFTQMDTDLDLSFFDGDVFADKVKSEYIHRIGKTTTYTIIFDDPSTNIDGVGDTNGLLLQPQIQLKEKDLLAPISIGDRVTVRGVRYYVDNYYSDGVGVITAYLTRK
jgi:hypothetical protein|tara:strand:- start:13601 stop:14008 length:408 start_codon:yes stop_codon:yes gene_type:complete